MSSVETERSESDEFAQDCEEMAKRLEDRGEDKWAERFHRIAETLQERGSE